MKKMNKITNTLVLLLPVFAMGAAIADEGTDRDERATPANMTWNEPAPVPKPSQPAKPIQVAWVAESPATPPKPPRPDMPDRMMWVEHINIEGDVDRDELRARADEIRTEALRDQFLQFDLDGDGFITQAEFTEVMVQNAKKNAEQMFQRFRDDGTGAISEERFIENFQERRIHVTRGLAARDLSSEDRERIRQARELAREAAGEGRQRVIELRAKEIELHGERLRARGNHVTKTVDEDGNEIITIKRKKEKDD